MTPVKLWLILSPPGARGDFLAGWLGTLPGFIDNQWFIYPDTGVSQCLGRNFKPIDIIDGMSILECANSLGYNITTDTGADILVATFHGSQTVQAFKDPVELKLIIIDYPQHLMPQIRWEFFAKTFLTKRFGQPILAPDQLDEEYKIAKILDKYYHNELKKIQLPQDTVWLDYQSVFQPGAGGSNYLCNQLGITVPDRWHRYFETMLYWSITPDELTVAGRTWKKSDFM